MKRTKTYATLMVLGVFAYLVLAITFWQAATAEEPSLSKVNGMHILYYHDDPKWRNLAISIVSAQIEGQLTGWMDAAATIVSVKDESDWLEAYADIEKVVNECPLYKYSRSQMTEIWIRYTSTKRDADISIATLFFINEACAEQLATVAEYTSLPAAKSRTSTKEGT